MSIHRKNVILLVIWLIALIVKEFVNQDWVDFMRGGVWTLFLVIMIDNIYSLFKQK